MERNAGKLDYVCHLLAWLGGGLIALTPFVRGWSVVVGGVATPVQVWPGNLIVEFMVATALGLLGTTLGGFWWGGGGGRESRRGRVAAVGLAGWGVAGWLGVLPEVLYWVCTTAMLGDLVISWWRTRRRRRAAGPARQLDGGQPSRLSRSAAASAAVPMVGAGPTEPRQSEQAGRPFSNPAGTAVLRGDVAPAMPWNGVLCGLILALCISSDLMVLGKLEGPRSAILALVGVRVLTEVVIVSFVWCWLQWYVRWSPVGTRWLVGVLLGVILVLLAAEIGMSQLWGKGLTLFFGELAVGGKFDLLRVMEGGSFKVTPVLGLTAAGVLLVVVGIYQGSGWLSRRLGLRVRPATLLAVAVGTWLLLLLEQASELIWNDRGGHWLQRRALLVHLCPSFSEPGWATFAVAFRDAARPVGLGVTRRPDVHLFIVETLRGDAMRPEVMPFLSHWRDTECQPVGPAYAASNATHLSWFAMLSGKPPVFWDRARQAQRPAPLLELLHAAGYRNELRSASIFDYAEMDTTNFGHGELTDVMVNTRINPNSWSAGPSERDRQVFDMWRQSVLAQPPGGTFRLTAVESPHYPYHWAASFVPPCPDYYRSAMFPLRPSAREIQLVRNSYHNSVAWVDSLFRDYIGFLKTQGRYDDAMIVITGDHGEELQERGFWFHASALTPEQTAVPVLVKWPKDLGRGEPVGQASHLDVVPSVMDALGCPAEQWQGLAGRSLRQGGDPTALVMTHFASQNGEGMHWRRNGYEAAFAWKKIWVPGMPERLWLERVTGPQGTMRFASPAAAEAALREHFPDAFERWFTRFERDQSSD